MNRARAGHLSSRARLAFTLVEMLVVIGLLMLLLGLSIGAVMRTPTHDRLLTTEQLLADLIRQARHTARSTGAPVVLTISATTDDIKGVSQVPVWNESFEEATPPTACSDWYFQSGSNPQQRNLGQTGWGVTNPASGPAVAPDDFPTYSLLHNQALTRGGSSTSTEGFYLCCAIQPPDPTAASGLPIPLVLVGNTTDSAATCGLALVNRTVTVQTVLNILNNNPVPATYSCWDLVGWVNCISSGGGPGGGLVTISAVNNTIAPSVVLPGLGPADAGGPQVLDVNGPLVGGHWEEVGLLYDGISLQLLHNGQLVAQLPAPGSATAVPQLTTTLLDTTQGGQGQQIFLGQGQLTNVVSAVTGAPGPQVPTYLQGSLDNCRLFRLGTDRPTPLPNGVQPAMTYILQVRPDGVIQYSQQPVNGTATIPALPTSNGSTILTFSIIKEATGANGLSADQVNLTLMPDGSFISAIAPGTSVQAVSQ